jgi:hypothetical protein
MNLANTASIPPFCGLHYAFLRGNLKKIGRIFWGWGSPRHLAHPAIQHIDGFALHIAFQEALKLQRKADGIKAPIGFE